MNKYVAIILQTVCMAIASADPINRVSWVAETTKAMPERLTCYRGETVELNADLYTSGHPTDLHGATATLFWQTNGMDSAWWTAPADVASNRITVAFTPAMQPNAASVLFFLGASTSEGSSYRANGQIRIIHSPGETPNVLPLPPHDVLDFAAVTVTNAPWITPADLSSVVKGNVPNSTTADFSLAAGLSEFTLQDGLILRRMSARPPRNWGSLYEPRGAYVYDGDFDARYMANGINVRVGGVGQTLSFPKPSSLPNTIAVVSDIEAAAEQLKLTADLHWDEPAGILWRTVYSNGYITVIAVTNVPAINQ